MSLTDPIESLAQEMADELRVAISGMNESLSVIEAATRNLEIKIISLVSARIIKYRDKALKAPRLIRWYYLKKIEKEERNLADLCKIIDERHDAKTKEN